MGTGLVPGSALSISVVAVEFAKKGHLSYDKEQLQRKNTVLIVSPWNSGLESTRVGEHSHC